MPEGERKGWYLIYIPAKILDLIILGFACSARKRKDKFDSTVGAVLCFT